MVVYYIPLSAGVVLVGHCGDIFYCALHYW